MTLKDKWLTANSPDDPVSQAARCAFEQRFEVVLHYHPLAAKHSDDDIEHVHQLRVASRRAVAAIDVFAPMVGRRKAEEMRKWMRRIRKSAGDARDLDVLSQRLLTDSELSKSQRRVYLAALRNRRDEAQRSIIACYERARRKKLSQRMQNLVQSVHWRGDNPEPTLATFGRATLESEMPRFLECAAGDLSTFDRLHRLRIEGKQIRYAMELLAAGFPKSFREELYPRVEELQERLGHINDLSAASNRWTRWLGPDSGSDTATVDATASAQRGFAEEAAAEFRIWWSADRIEAFRATWESVCQ